MLKLLALIDEPVWNGEELEFSDPALSPWDLFWYWLRSGPLWLCYMALLIWMLIYCVRNDPARWFWVWIMLIVQPIGPLVYFVVRYLPSANFENWGLLKRWRKLRTLSRLEAAALHIGNAYQFVQLADTLRELKRHDRAAQAYAQALAKEPNNLAALWGAASIDFLQKDYATARTRLGTILEQDFAYKFGDVSLLFAKTLIALNETAVAKTHLEQHVRKWRQPEALYLLAKLCLEQSNPDEARSHLQGLIIDINSSPRAIARKQLFWKSRAQRLLRHLPKSATV